ncbi:ThiF family adenylyltransferase [Candidatus Uhrbacteria bacterium]|nr:ThiF family adenylyltransferase [Candidatus Uhrbacteria bacterium]
MTATVTDPSFLSRERLAGYDPHVLSGTRVALVGAGALGQNAALALALSGVRTLIVVDPDAFEESNRTRSPFYQKDAPKAPAVAEGFLRSATHPGAEAYHHLGLVQAVGDLLAGARGPWYPHALISAVDSNETRAYLSELCRRSRLPLVEAGFEGPQLAVTVIANHPGIPDEPCWGCGRRSLRDASTRGLCTLYARQAEAAGFSPAIQSAAQVAGALVAEAAIGFAHAHLLSDGFETDPALLPRYVPLAGHRWHLDIRTGRSVLTTLVSDPDCRLDHVPFGEEAARVPGEPATLYELFEALRRLGLPCSEIQLSEPVVVSLPCAGCGRPVVVNQPRYAVTSAPRCPGDSCSPGSAPGLPDLRSVLRASDAVLLDVPLPRLGLGPGAVARADGALVQLPGTVPGVFPRLSLTPHSEEE